MAHLVILIRAGDEIRECNVYTRECGLMVLDTLGQQTTYHFPLEQSLPDFWQEEFKEPSQSKLCVRHRHRQPHRRFCDVVFNWHLSPSSKHSRGYDSPCRGPSLCDISQSTGCFQDSIAVTPDNTTTVQDITSHFTGQYELPGDVQYLDFYDEEFKHHIPKWQLFVLPHFICTMLVNGHVASCLAKCVRMNQKFRRRFCKRLFQIKAFRDLVPEYLSWGVAEFEKLDLLAVPYLIDIVSVWPEQRLDYAWGWRMNHLLTKRMLLEEAMAWLSTLGGAHSSLGEYFTHHAEIAGHISVKQLRIAVEMGDPFTVARCYMFWAYSLLQRGFTRKARSIVRRVYRFAANHPVKNTLLINMCLAAWKRLQHLHRVKRQAEHQHGSSEQRRHCTLSAKRYGPQEPAALYG